MQRGSEAALRSENLAELRAQSLRLISPIASMLAYVWLAFAIWPVTGGTPSAATLGGASTLFLCSLLVPIVRERCLSLASWLLVVGTMVAVSSALAASGLPNMAALFGVPIVLGSALLSGWGLLLVTCTAASLTAAISWRVLGLPPTSGPVALAIVANLVVGAVAWLSARNIHIAMDWMWQSYESARKSETTMRAGQAELRRALKSLDEASNRIERVNYMLVVARGQAEEARHLKQQFAQTISHELRTPLNVVIGFTELMLQSPEYYGGPLPASYLRDLSIVQRNARHLQGLVNDVLDLARIEAAQMSLLPEKTSPDLLVHESVDIVRSLIESRGLELRTAIEPDMPSLWADPTRIRQVLLNLLNNAARFTEHGSITVTACRKEAEIIFAVADTGVGISPTDMRHLFEDFRQVDQAARRQQDGAGLGLAISRRFVELHQGRIWVESQPGRGSTFYFGLPLGTTGAAALPIVSAVGQRGEIGQTGDGPVLLAVTHSPLAAGLLTRYMRGYRVVVAHDLVQAHSIAGKLTPQAVVIDSTSQALDNEALLGLGRAWGLPYCPFLACPFPGEEPLRQLLAVDGYVIKPVTRDRLWDVLRQFGAETDRILLVDDDRDFVLLMSRLLEDSPVRRYQVRSAYSGSQCLELLQHDSPDLIFLDLNLPDMEGAALMERIRANPAWSRIPIVVVSGQDDMEGVQSLQGPLVVTRADGLLPGEVLQAMQQLLDTILRKHHPATRTLA